MTFILSSRIGVRNVCILLAVRGRRFSVHPLSTRCAYGAKQRARIGDLAMFKWGKCLLQRVMSNYVNY